jgi:hypothetical protein
MKTNFIKLSSALLLGFMSLKSLAQAPTYQIIHNCADAAASSVKIWANGSVLVNSLSFRNATSTGTVAAGVYTIGVSSPTAINQNQSLAQFTVTFANNVDYKIVANGIVSPTGYNPTALMAPFTLHTYTTAAGPNPGPAQTQILVNHGSTDAPTVDVVAPFTGTMPVLPNVLVNNAAYSNFSPWLTVSTSDIKIQVRDQFTENVVKEYSAPLQSLLLGGSRISVIASGFLAPANNSNGPGFGLWVATAAGGSLIALPTTTTTSTRFQAIHNCADAAAAQVDVWFNSGPTPTSAILIANNFAFRSATPFLDIPAGQTVTVSIAPPTSTSVSQAIANFTYNLSNSSKYQLIASGVVSPIGYTPSSTLAPFTLIANANVRERALVGTNTDVLIFHGATDAPTVGVTAWPSPSLASGLAYSNYNSLGYNALPTNDYSISLTAGGSTVASYGAPLAALSLTGQAITVLASGFLTPANNSNGPSFGLWVALASGGTLIPLPLINPTSPTAIDEKSKLKDFLSVYPNPFNSSLIVKNTSDTELTISITDINSKVVVKQTSNSEMIDLNTSELSSGIYIINIRNNESESNYKLVK